MKARATRIPVWQAIADDLRESLSDGRYATGDRLPTEATLAKRFGVNRHTVRRAVAHLASEGLLHTRRGSGSFVLDRPFDYPLGRRVRFHQNLLAAGRLPDKRILSIESEIANDREAKLLSIAVGDPVAVMRALSLANNRPIALTEGRFPQRPGLAQALKREASITRALAAIGITDYVRTSTRLTATTATATQALHLRLSIGAPLLLAEQLSKTGNGQPIEHGRTWFASERVTLTLDHNVLHEPPMPAAGIQ